MIASLTEEIAASGEALIQLCDQLDNEKLGDTKESEDVEIFLEKIDSDDDLAA